MLQVFVILDEYILSGEIMETSKSVAPSYISLHQDPFFALDKELRLLSCIRRTAFDQPCACTRCA